MLKSVFFIAESTLYIADVNYCSRSSISVKCFLSLMLLLIILLCVCVHTHTHHQTNLINSKHEKHVFIDTIVKVSQC